MAFRRGFCSPPSQERCQGETLVNSATWSCCAEALGVPPCRRNPATLPKSEVLPKRRAQAGSTNRELPDMLQPSTLHSPKTNASAARLRR